MHGLVLISINLHTKFEVHSFIHSKDITGAPKLQNRSRDPDHAHQGVVCHPRANTSYSLPVYKI